jgi:pimeloyl-ACP methyl ester carboxylesterase
MKLSSRYHRLSQPQGSEEGFAPLSYYTAQYVGWGDGQPLVLVPALAGGIGLVSTLGEHLASEFRVISYQLRGEEDCFAVRQRFDLQDLVVDLAELLDYLGLERPILCGVSFGGVLALEFAARHPRRLGGLVVQGADVRFQRSLLRFVAGHVLAGYPLPSDNAFVNQFFNLLFGGRPRDRQLFEFVTGQSWQTDQSVIAHRFQLAERLDLRGRLGGIHVPTLVLNGDRDILVSKRGLQEMRSTLPQSEFAALPNAGHLAFVTHPVEITRHVQRFGRKQGWLRETNADD